MELHLNKATPDMWDKVLKAFRETLQKAEDTYLAKAKSKIHLYHHHICKLIGAFLRLQLYRRRELDRFGHPS